MAPHTVEGTDEGLDSPASSTGGGSYPLRNNDSSGLDACKPGKLGQGPVFPDRFMKGIGMSVWQNSCDGQDVVDAAESAEAARRGHPPSSGTPQHPPRTSNWYNFARKHKFFGQAKEFAAAWKTSNDFWNQYETHIKLAKDSLGTNSFRFSFEWARLEPEGPGKVDEAAVLRYHAIIDTIIANGMEPMCTLHHFTHPQWFEDMGGFVKEENNDLFVDYCRRVFGWFGQKIKLWATFNEPTCFSFVGYIAGLWCPGQRMGFTLAGKVLLNLLKAHVQVYQLLKTMPGGPEACIGLVHQHIRFYSRSKYAPHISLLCRWMTYWFATDVLTKFFTTGVFEWKAPFKGVTVTYKCKDAPRSLDWWGINYYTYPCVSPYLTLCSKNKEPLSDIGFRIYPQGMYDSIKDASVLKVPIYITETGSADKEGRHRKYMIDGHSKAILDAIRDGCDVRGMYYWTLMDNIEWHEGFAVKFGLFEWDPKKGVHQDMRLRPGSEALRELYANLPDNVEEVHSSARSLDGLAGARSCNTSEPGSSDGMLESLAARNPLVSHARRHTVSSTAVVPS